jgi:16S rRNA (cytosine967-C5)-methyltransferase
MNTRLLAVRTLTQVVQQQGSLANLLPAAIKQLSHAQDQSLLQALCFGVCRYYHCLQYIAQQYLTKPLKPKDTDVWVSILLGVYQLLYLRIPDRAAVYETVKLAKLIKKPWANKLINAVLRNLQRQPITVPEENNIAYYSHPAWLIHLLQRHYPEHWQQILLANNQHPPLTLRVNPQYLSRDDYLQLLSKHHINADACEHSAHGIILQQAHPVDSLPGFAQGGFSVQDQAAQLAAGLLNLQPHQRVLDACCAPGGKTTHILETQPALASLYAIDQDPQRLHKVTENLQRLHLQHTVDLQVLAADVGQLDQWWDGEKFERILLDTPCSATGVIRRHPDIKLLRQAQDIPQLAKHQLQLLNTLWQCLAPNGLLLYATCSLLPEENQQVIQQFLTQHTQAEVVPLQVNWGINTEYGWQILPSAQSDGFFYCLLKN